MAWRNLGRHKRRSALTALAMGLVIAMSMFMGSMMAGMSNNMTEAIVDRSIGHVHINHADYPETVSAYDAVPDAAALLQTLRARDDVRAANGRINGFGLFSKDSEGEGASEGAVGAILGTDLDAEAELTRLDRAVTHGAYPAEQGSRSVIVGYRLAEELELAVGDRIIVVTSALDGSTGNDIYGVRGIYRTGTNRLDKSIVMDLALAQELTVQGDEVHEIVVVTTGDNDTIRDFVADAKNTWPDLAVRPWWEIRPEVVEMIAMSDGFNRVFIVVVLMVAAFGVINTLLMSVYERTREFGVMQAVGMRPAFIVQLVLAESMLLAMVSAVMGLAMGGVLDLYMIEVGLDLAVSEGEGFQVSGMTLDPVLHGAFRVQDAVIPTVTLFIVSAIGGLWPAMRAARLDPITAMRQE